MPLIRFDSQELELSKYITHSEVCFSNLLLKIIMSFAGTRYRYLQINIIVKSWSLDLGQKGVINTYFAPEVKFTFMLPRLGEGEYMENLAISVKMGHHFEVLLGNILHNIQTIYLLTMINISWWLLKKIRW